VQIESIWEAGAGAGLLLAGGLMAASPNSYLRLRERLPGLGVALRLRPSSESAAEITERWLVWRQRTRVLGFILAVPGMMILRAASRGEPVETSPHLFLGILRSLENGAKS